jgi:hypothetical protein
MEMEIASHSVSHSRAFKNFDIGDGEEDSSNYHPFVQTKTITNYGTVLGELKVSKRLLDNSLGINVVSFRPGHLTVPNSLPQMLVSSGYKYSSSVTANDAITHFPFQLSYDREDEKEVPIFEFPVTIEDEEGNMLERLDQYIKLADEIENENGIVVVLIHPNITDYKLEFEKRFVLAEMHKAAFMTVQEFGDWWSARNQVQVEIKDCRIIVESPEPIDGLTLLLPNGKSKVLPFFKDRFEIEYSSLHE